MTRDQIHSCAIDAVRDERRYLWFALDGDPNAARQRLLGHHLGPHGFIVGRLGTKNIVRFSSGYVMEYLDEASKDSVPYDHEFDLRVVTRDELLAHTFECETLGE